MQRYNLPYVIVFIPAYNEEGTIREVVEMINKKYRSSDELDYILDIIVINDGSTDRTADIARDSGVKKVISHPFNRGLGAATRTGMHMAFEMGADIAVKIDADYQHDPGDVDKVIRPILEDTADCVFGSRFTGGLKYKMPLYRHWGNKFFTWITGKITGLKITDGQTGLMAFHNRYLKVFTIISDYNETQQLIIDSWGRHMRVMEVPVLFHKRVSGQSFISWRYPFIVLPTIIRLFIHFKPLRVFLTAGLFVIVLGIINGLILMSWPDFILGDATLSVLIIVGFQIIFFGLLADQVSFRNR